MAFKACPDCGCRVYALGCVNCNEAAYIEAQEGYEPPRERDEDDGQQYADPRDEMEERLR